MSKTVRLEDVAALFGTVLAEGGEVAFVTSGVSMLPMLRDGKDKIFLTKAAGPLKKHDVPLIRREDGSFVLHRVVSIRPDGYVLRGDNQWYCETGFRDAQVIGVVRAYEKNGRRRECTDLSYRLYCVFLPLIRRVRKYFFACTDALTARRRDKTKGVD